MGSSNARSAQVSRAATSALANMAPATPAGLPNATSPNYRLRFRPMGQVHQMRTPTTDHEGEWKPTLNPLFSKVSISATNIFGNNLNQPFRSESQRGEILRFLPQEKPSQLAQSSVAANRLEINNRLEALQGTFKREGLASFKGSNPELADKSTNQLLSAIQNLQEKNRTLMKMAPPDSQQNGQVALKIENEYDKNKREIFPIQKEILQRLKKEGGQLTPLMVAVFDNHNPQKFSLDTASQIRFPQIPKEWNISDPSTQRFEQIKARANNLISQLEYSRFSDPGFCARREADVDVARRLSRLSPAQIASSTNIAALRQTLNKSLDNMQKARELSQLMAELNPKRNLADAEAFAHYKTIGFFAAKILKQLNRAQGESAPNWTSAFDSAASAGNRALSQLRPLSSRKATPEIDHSFGLRPIAQGSPESRMGTFVSGILSVRSNQTPPLSQSDRLIERSASSPSNQIANLRADLQMEQFRQSDTTSMTRLYENRYQQIGARGDLPAAQQELRLAKKERQNLQSLVQLMRKEGQTPGEVEQRAFSFYYYKAQAAEGLALQLEGR